MISAIYNLRDYGFIHTYNHHLSVGYTKILDNVKWEVSEDLNEGYVVKKNGIVKLLTEDFKEVIQYLTKNRVI